MASGKAASKGEPGWTIQKFTRATGTGSLEASRGSDHLSENGVVLAGEIDIFGKVFVAPFRAGSTWSGSTRSGSTWSGSTWSGSTWDHGKRIR